jgi:hypothetical protein
MVPESTGKQVDEVSQCDLYDEHRLSHISQLWVIQIRSNSAQFWRTRREKPGGTSRLPSTMVGIAPRTDVS